MHNIFQAVFGMTVTGCILFMLLFLLSPITSKLFSAKWHCRTNYINLAFFMLPIGFISAQFVKVIIKIHLAINTNPTLNLFEEFPLPMLQILNSSQVSMNSIQSTFWMKILFYVPILWLFGAVLFFTWKVVQLLRFQKLIDQTCEALTDINTLLIFENTKVDMGIYGNITLHKNPCIDAPMLAGLRNTKLILPEIHFSSQELALVFRHELTHYQHGDLWIKLVALLACTVHWFNPMVYLFSKSLDSSIEIFCDADVVRHMNYAERHAYGTTILNVLSRVSGRQSGIYASFCENKFNMKRRLLFMLKERDQTKKLGILSLFILACVCAVGLNVSAATYKLGKPAKDTTAITNDNTASSDYEESLPVAQQPQTVINQFFWPVPPQTEYVIIGFGDYEGHSGMDIACPLDTPVYAANSGTVVFAKETPSPYGNYIIIDHGGGYTTLYGHNKSLNVAKGDIVTAGQMIANVGKSGFSTGNKLHFEVRKDGDILNPELYVNAENLLMEFPEN